jgi:hypothetical protein
VYVDVHVDVRLVLCVAGDFMDAKAKVKLYGEVQDSGRLVSVVEEYLGDFNSMTKKPMDLVMFMFFVQVLYHASPALPYPTQLSCSMHRVVSTQTQSRCACPLAASPAVE